MIAVPVRAEMITRPDRIRRMAVAETDRSLCIIAIRPLGTAEVHEAEFQPAPERLSEGYAAVCHD